MVRYYLSIDVACNKGEEHDAAAPANAGQCVSASMFNLYKHLGRWC
jgi:hypothetical protein